MMLFLCSHLVKIASKQAVILKRSHLEVVLSFKLIVKLNSLMIMIMILKNSQMIRKTKIWVKWLAILWIIRMVQVGLLLICMIQIRHKLMKTQEIKRLKIAGQLKLKMKVLVQKVLKKNQKMLKLRNLQVLKPRNLKVLCKSRS